MKDLGATGCPQIFVLFDELELFFENDAFFDRDRRIVRDLLFAIVRYNNLFAEYNLPIHLLAAVRSEVLNSVSEIGQEVVRDVEDFSYVINWSERSSGSNHPLLELLERKIRSSYREVIGEEFVGDVWDMFFPKYVSELPLKEYLLLSSLMRPRDLVRRLSVAREHRPNAEKFTQAAFDESALQYSNWIWSEIYDELLAKYSLEDIKCIENLFTGFYSHFFIDELKHRITHRFSANRTAQLLFYDKGLEQILQDLFRLGAIGNDFIITDHVESGEIRKVTRNRWIYRGNTELLVEERMTIHRSLWKRFSVGIRKGIPRMGIFKKC